MKLSIALAGIVAFSQAAYAQPAQHPPGHAMANPATAATNADDAAIKDILSRYKSAIERLDATGTEALFAPDSAIFETGGVEGTYAQYLGHHLGPELKEFKAFKFSDYKVDVYLLGPTAAHANETYKYRIETKSGEIVERLGVATTVLSKENDRWKIVMMHNSGRKPKPAS